MNVRHIVIIGNGIAGITTARHLRQRTSDRITVISAESKYFFSRTALMYVYMGHMTAEQMQPYEPWFWQKNRIELKQAKVEKANTESKTLLLEGGEVIPFDVLVLATGSKPNKFGWPGQDLPGVQGLYSLQDLQLLEQNTHPPFTSAESQRVHTAVIVGGGLIGVELAEMLLTRNIRVIFLARENRFWGQVLPEEDAEMIGAHIESHGVELRLNQELKKIIGGPDGRVRAVETLSGEIIPCELVGLTAGVSPNIDFLKDSGIETDRGILVDELLQTNVPGVYAIGDCAQFRTPPPGRQAVEQVWYTGRMMGECLAATLSGSPTPYQPGPWFNSAKFFDIEFQTYGHVTAQRTEHEMRFFWKHPIKNVAVHVVWEKTSGRFSGINTWGMRVRHEMFDRWLRQGAHVHEVMQNLDKANFDVVFSRDHSHDILEAFNKQTGSHLQSSQKAERGLFRFLKSKSA